MQPLPTQLQKLTQGLLQEPQFVVVVKSVQLPVQHAQRLEPQEKHVVPSVAFWVLQVPALHTPTTQSPETMQLPQSTVRGWPQLSVPLKGPQE